MDSDMPTKTHDDSEVDTPPHTSHPIKPFSYSVGAPKYRPPPQPSVAYKECMKNYAATIGGHAVDGYDEFLPPPPSATSLKCAACGCHQSFYRRELVSPPFLDFRHPGGYNVFFEAGEQQAPVTPAAENPGGRKRFRTRFTQEQKEKMQAFSVAVENPGGRKRFRTRITQEQKEKMQAFSAALGWKMQRCDEEAMKEFCREIGVMRGVLKVWMHNNKNVFVKRYANGGGLISSDDDGCGDGHFQNKGNGSSSS